MRFSEAITKFTQFRALEKEAKTVKGYDLDLRQFALWMRNPLITQVTPDHVVEYINGMKELGWNQNSVLIKCVCFSQFFKFWAQKGYPVLNYNLIPHIKREYHLPKVADIGDFKKLIAVCDAHTEVGYIRNKAMLLQLFETGVRNGELCSMNVDINTSTKNEEGQYSYVLKSEKSRGKAPYRRVFWTEETNEAIKKWIAVRKTLPYLKDEKALYIGVAGKGDHNAGNRLQSYSFGLVLRRLSKEAGLDYVFNAHSLRHRFGIDSANSDLNNSTISSLMGHANLNSSFIYTQITGKDQARAHAKIKRELKK